MTDKNNGFPSGSHSNGHHKNGSYNGAYSPGNDFSNSHDDEDEIDLKHIFYTGWRYKWIIIVLILITTVSSYFYAQSLTPIYRADSKLMIAEMRSRYTMGGSDLSSLLTGSFGIGMGSTISNELQILNSRRFLGHLADRLKETPYDSKGNLFPVLQYRTESGEIIMAERETVVSRLRGLSFNQADKESDVINISFESSSPEEAQLVANLLIDTYYDFSTRENRQVARSAIDFLDSELEQVGGTLARSEQELRDFMNKEKLVAMEEQSRMLVDQLAHMEAESRKLEVKLAAVRSALDNYNQELESIRPGLPEQVANVNAPRLELLSQSLAELETERFLLINEYPELAEFPEREEKMVTLNRRIEQIRNQITQVTVDVMANDERYLGFLQSADGKLFDKINEMRGQVLALTVEENQLSAQKDMLNSRIAELEANFDGLPDNMITYTRLYRELRMNEQLYITVSKQASELKVWEQTQLGYGRLVDYATLPSNPVKPRIPIFMLIGFGIGLGLSIGYIFLREVMANEIRSIDYLRGTGHQLLAVIPDITPIVRKQFDGKKYVEAEGHQVSTDLICLLDPVSPASEAYRRLFNNVLYSKPDHPFKKIVVTSAGQGEGKSTTLSNLAISIAESGRSVIMVDCDFRRPRVHKEFGLTEDFGVSDVLFDEAELEDVKKTGVVPGLDLITTGKKVANPSALVQSKKMAEMIEALEKQYEYVLIDAPPFGILTDAAPLMKTADGALVCARFGQTRRHDLSHTLENLENIRVPVIGLVMTSFDHKKATGYYYSSDYYRYAYQSYNKYVTSSDQG